MLSGGGNGKVLMVIGILVALAVAAKNNSNDPAKAATTAAGM
jgi:hypothetical protein